MFRRSRKNRIAFRPTVDDVRLEDRVVLNAAATSAPWMGYLRGGPGGPPGQPGLPPQPPGRPGLPGLPGLPGHVGRPGRGDLIEARRLNDLYRQQFRNTEQALQRYARVQIANAYATPGNLAADGRLTAQALADLQANLNGALDAVAYQVSSQAALLPGAAGGDLIARLQDGLLGAQRNSLASRIATTLNSGRLGRSEALLQNAVDRQIARGFLGNTMQLNNFLRSTPLTSLSVDSAGQRIPISQYMGNQAALQINNTLGSLANSVGPYARSALFDATTGAYNPQAAAAFQQQYNNALNTAAYQAGSLLSLFPNSSATASQLGAAFFGNGTNSATGQPNTSFMNAFSGVFPTNTGTGTTPFTSDAFNTAYQNGFTGAYQNAISPLNNFFGIQSQGGTGASALPSGFFESGATFPGVFNSQYGAGFNSGFNNGFLANGSGVPGFGTVPTGFNAGFGTGFNNYLTSTSGGVGPYPTYGYLSGVTGVGGVGPYPTFGYLSGVTGVRGIGGVNGLGGTNGFQGATGLGGAAGLGGVSGLGGAPGLGAPGGFL